MVRKLILLAASCFFYAYWDWRFLGLLATVTILDFFVSRLLVTSPSDRQRKMLLSLSICINLGFLGWFKYFNFFLDSLNAAIAPLGGHMGNLAIILPIGISFYTFETLSYVIDIYRGVAKPANSLLDYAIFITFFPRLVAGPIMRASQFLPQLERGIRITPEGLSNGAQLFLVGMIKKLVIADNLAIFVDQVYRAPTVFNSATVWLALFSYSVQIFCDFSGYTDMATGVGLMLGIQLPDNFKLPYTAQSITEFWQRWHISLSTWLRDYLYIPLGGNRKGSFRTYINLMITMLLGGLWHGASWNFVIWGGLHGFYLAFERIFQKGQKPGGWKQVSTWLKGVLTFIVVTFTWIFFRSSSTTTTQAILSKSLFLDPGGIRWAYTPALIGIPVVILGGFLLRLFDQGFRPLPLSKSYTIPAMILAALVVFFFASLNVSPFIYFQF